MEYSPKHVSQNPGSVPALDCTTGMRQEICFMEIRTLILMPVKPGDEEAAISLQEGKGVS